MKKNSNTVVFIIWFSLMIFFLWIKNIPWVGVIFTSGAVYFLYRSGKIQLDTIIRGILISLTAGLFISFFTDGNFRASIEGPLIQLARLCKIKLSYISDNWIVTKKIEERNMLEVEVANTETGAIFKIDKKPSSVLYALPPDLRYTILTSDNKPLSIPLKTLSSGNEPTAGIVIWDYEKQKKYNSSLQPKAPDKN